MNNLGANYERILEILRKMSKEHLLTDQSPKSKMSDLVLTSLNLTSEIQLYLCSQQKPWLKINWKVLILVLTSTQINLLI